MKWLLRPHIQRDTALVLLPLGLTIFVALFADGVPCVLRVVGFPASGGLTVWSLFQLVAANRVARQRAATVERFTTFINGGMEIHRRARKGRHDDTIDSKDQYGRVPWMAECSAWIAAKFGEHEAENLRGAHEETMSAPNPRPLAGEVHRTVLADVYWLQAALQRYTSGTLKARDE